MQGEELASATGRATVRLRLQVAYDGRRFHGFVAQRAPLRTVASALADAIAKVVRLDSAPELTCAGRTDAGVHAWDQWAHVDLPIAPKEASDLGAPGDAGPSLARLALGGLDLGGLQRRLVKLLAPEIVVRSASLAPKGWDARHSALSRTYRYTVLTSPVPDPFQAGVVWWAPGELDLRAMQLASDAIVGEHDFSSFCRRQRRANGEPISRVRRVLDAGWVQTAPGTVRFEVTANAFCQQMVRSLVGTLVDIGRGRRRAGELSGVLRAQDRAAAGPLAPPDGLVLWHVAYPPEAEAEAEALAEAEAVAGSG